MAFPWVLLHFNHLVHYRENGTRQAGNLGLPPTASLLPGQYLQTHNY